MQKKIHNNKAETEQQKQLQHKQQQQQKNKALVNCMTSGLFLHNYCVSFRPDTKPLIKETESSSELLLLTCRES